MTSRMPRRQVVLLPVVAVALISTLFISSCDANDLGSRSNAGSSSKAEAIPSGRKAIFLEDAKHWNRVGSVELQRALGLVENTKPAKRIILFIGDGMGMSTVTAARIFGGQMKKNSNSPNGEENLLFFETFPHSGLIKTYCVDKQVPDSASTATAMLSGVKTNCGTLGVSQAVPRGNCAASNEQRNRLDNIFNWAQNSGLSTGIVTTSRITHATPAAGFAISAERDWECDGRMNRTLTEAGCLDIARQLIENEPGSKLNVIMGGGRQYLEANATSWELDPVLKDACQRKDGLNLTESWMQRKRQEKSRHRYVQNIEQLREAVSGKGKGLDNLLGLFSNDHMEYEGLRNKSAIGQPSLSEMSRSAIEILARNKKGFFLMIEGARIDHAHHEGHARLALEETIAMDDAVNDTVQTLKGLGILDETLLIVTADHSHTMTINGYPNRGNDILGLAEKSDTDKMPYTTLSYANGPGFTYEVVDGKVKRKNLTEVDTTARDYHQQASVPLKAETHGGEDVAIYAMGPMSHLFSGVHEQNYISHAMSYAMCVGSHSNDMCRRREPMGAQETGDQLDVIDINVIDQGPSSSAPASVHRGGGLQSALFYFYTVPLFFSIMYRVPTFAVASYS